MNNKFIKTLNADIILNIKNDLESKENKMTQKNIAKKYNVSVATISRIKNNKINIESYINCNLKCNDLNSDLNIEKMAFEVMENVENICNKYDNLKLKYNELVKEFVKIVDGTKKVKSCFEYINNYVKSLEYKNNRISERNYDLIKENKDLLNKLEKLEKEVFLLDLRKDTLENENRILKAQIEDLEFKGQNILHDNKNALDDILDSKKDHSNNSMLMDLFNK